MSRNIKRIFSNDNLLFLNQFEVSSSERSLIKKLGMIGGLDLCLGLPLETDHEWRIVYVVSSMLNERVELYSCSVLPETLIGL